MPTELEHLERLENERGELNAATRFHWFHWYIVFLSLALTTGAWYFAKSQADGRQQVRFEQEASHVVDLINERMHQYEDALWSGVAAIRTVGEDISLADWRTFSGSLRIHERYPGINGIGVIWELKPDELDQFLAKQRLLRPEFNVFPAHDQDTLMPITYIEPETVNAAAVGLDIAHESNRRQAALNSRSSGKAQITGPIVLVQDAGKTPGFLFYAPFYKEGKQSTTVEREESFHGMVYAPFVVRKLMEGVLDKDRRRIGVRITDGDSVMYDEHIAAEEDYDPNPLFTYDVTVDDYGRTWSYDVRSTKSFRAAYGTSQPIVILIGGLVIDSLIIAFFVMLCRSNKRALQFADRMTEELRAKVNALAVSNEELETFAYVASHDLKTPLRGIGDLTEYLEEDLDSYMADSSANPDVRRNIDRLYGQVGRMENLIKGILDYSSLTSEPMTVEIVLLPAMLDSIRSEIGLNADQLSISNDCPRSFPTHATRFEQVISNLIGNACKYHHDQQNAIITVGCRPIGGFYRFSVADNGPGIEKQFHSRIFEVFQSLHSKDDIDSSGVGLSIVKKIVESYGGKVQIQSVVGEGTTFSFDWPKEILLKPRAKQG